MPKVADPAVRMALIENAARITAEEGREALTLRRLTREVGASTMAVYTHFGGMLELRRAVRREGFARLGAHLGAVDETGDTVADLLALRDAYVRMAVENPNLYRAMFMDGAVDEEDAGIGLETYEPLLRAVNRAIAAGRFDPAVPHEVARQIWATLHGFVALQIAGMMPLDEVTAGLDASSRNLFTAFGDTPAAFARSRKQAASR